MAKRHSTSNPQMRSGGDQFCPLPYLNTRIEELADELDAFRNAEDPGLIPGLEGRLIMLRELPIPIKIIELFSKSNSELLPS